MKMSHPISFAASSVLIAQIESQRMELNQAYRQLEKPIHYGEQALKGFGFLRRNPWIAMAAPGVTSLLFSGLSGLLMRRGKPAEGRAGQPRSGKSSRPSRPRKPRRRSRCASGSATR